MVRVFIKSALFAGFLLGAAGQAAGQTVPQCEDTWVASLESLQSDGGNQFRIEENCLSNKKRVVSIARVNRGRTQRENRTYQMVVAEARIGREVVLITQGKRGKVTAYRISETAMRDGWVLSKYQLDPYRDVEKVSRKRPLAGTGFRALGSIKTGGVRYIAMAQRMNGTDYPVLVKLTPKSKAHAAMAFLRTGEAVRLVVPEGATHDFLYHRNVSDPRVKATASSDFIRYF